MAFIADLRGSGQPVEQTRQALRAHGTPVIALSDSDAVRQDIENLAAQLGLSAASDTLEDGTFRTVLQPVSAGVLGSVLTVPEPELPLHHPEFPPLPSNRPASAGDVIVALSSDRMGDGDDALGAALMTEFVHALPLLTRTPDAVLLYNSGVKLACAGTETAPDLYALSCRGCDILVCRVCLEHYGLAGRLAVGEKADMFSLAEKLMHAERIIRP